VPETEGTVSGTEGSLKLLLELMNPLIYSINMTLKVCWRQLLLKGIRIQEKMEGLRSKLLRLGVFVLTEMLMSDG
jgi:hypothetical protein